MMMMTMKIKMEEEEENRRRRRGGGGGGQQRDLGSKPCQEPGFPKIFQMEGQHLTPGPLNYHPYNAMTIRTQRHKKDRKGRKLLYYAEPRHKRNSTEQDLCCQDSGH
jgi:hypothetical protein